MTLSTLSNEAIFHLQIQKKAKTMLRILQLNARDIRRLRRQMRQTTPKIKNLLVFMSLVRTEQLILRNLKAQVTTPKVEQF